MQRHYLWKYQAASDGPPVVLGIVSKKKPSVKIRERILNAAYQTYIDSKQSLFVVGQLQCGMPEAEGLDVEVNAVRGKPQPGSPRSADFLASCRFCRLAEARDPNDTVLDLVEDVKTKQYSLAAGASASTVSATGRITATGLRQLTNFFSLDIHGKLEGPNCSVDISFVCFERRLNAYKINKLPVAENTVFRMLRQLRKELLWGWVQTSKGSCHLLEKDDARQDVTGVWISGVKSPHHPLVWLVCQHFLNSVQPAPPYARPCATSYGGKQRFPQTMAKDIFALIIFDQSGDSASYTVTPIDDVMRTVVLSGVEKTTVTRVFSARDRLVDIHLDLCFVDDGDFTFDTTTINNADKNNLTLQKQVRKELAAENNHLLERGQKSTAQQTDQDADAERYRIATRRDAPLLPSSNLGQQEYTPASVGLHKEIQPKRILQNISPQSSQALSPLESLGKMGPSASSTPMDRIIHQQAQRQNRIHPEHQLSDRNFAPSCRFSEATESRRSKDVPPELLDIIRKQELEISLLKEQLQMLIVNSNNNSSNSNNGCTNQRRSNENRSADNDKTDHQRMISNEKRQTKGGSRQPPTGVVDNPIDLETACSVDSYRRPISPPETPPRPFTPMRPYEPNTPGAHSRDNHPSELDSDLLLNSARFYQYYTEDKENRSNEVFSKQPFNQQLDLYNGNVFRPEPLNQIDAAPWDFLNPDVGNVLREKDSINGGERQQLRDVVLAGSFAMPRLGDQLKASTAQVAHQDIMLQAEPLSSSKNLNNGNSTNSLVGPPRLRYESLVLSGTQPSVLVDQVTRKYFGRSPQMPTTAVTGNAMLSKPHLLGTGKTSPQMGMLRRVLTAEATKQVLGQNGEVSLITRKYTQMEDMQHFEGGGANGRLADERYPRNSSDERPERFLDVDALKRQPKLL